VGFVPLLLVSNGFNGILDSIVNSSTKVEPSGIYATTIFAAISFLLSFVFYYKYEEDISELN
jgi:GPH family glycoside/pentoside/hexuronide:cation symporter